MAKRKKKSDQVEPIAEIESTAETLDAADPVVDWAVASTDDAENEEFDAGPEFAEIEPGVRQSPRQTVRVQTVVQFKESEEDTWKEMVDVTTVSRNGAALTLSRPCPVGRIVSLVMQMPASLRLYDHYGPVYPMLAIVQNCTSTIVNDKPVYHVGVAFIGKKMPETYRSDPRQCFRISGISKDGLWQPIECANQFKSRKHSRFWRSLEVTVTVRDQARRTSHREDVFTRDVSAGGMATFGPLNAEIGDRVKIASKDPEFYSIAIVRNRTENEQDETKPLVHFEFDGGKFPIEKLPMPGKDKEAKPAAEEIEEVASSEE